MEKKRTKRQTAVQTGKHVQHATCHGLLGTDRQHDSNHLTSFNSHAAMEGNVALSEGTYGSRCIAAAIDISGL